MTPLLAQRPRSDRAFERMYRRHVGDVYRYALAVMRNPADAEDVTQTTFLNALRAYERGERPRAEQNWLIAIAYNVCRQRFRQSLRRPREVSLDEDDSALTFKVPLAPIETGISLRDVHLHQMLETDKYPAATLRILRSQLTFPKEREPVERTAEGELTLHGQSRTVKVHYRAELGASGVTKVRGSFQLDMRDFDIKAPSYLGVSVAPKVEVSVELALTGPGARPQHAEGGNEVR